MNPYIHYRPGTKHSIFRLNGYANPIRQSQDVRRISFLLERFKKPNKLLPEMLNAYYLLIKESRNHFSGITFAWEDLGLIRDMLEVACKEIAETETLVVIGYSFPFFNRKIDRKLIESMPGLNKIYFQAEDQDNARKMRVSFRSVSEGLRVTEDQLELIVEEKKFFLPPEL